jgi:hypothetical protein
VFFFESACAAQERRTFPKKRLFINPLHNKKTHNNYLHQPHYTSPDSPPLVTSFTSAAIAARPGASRPPQTRRHGGRRAKRQQQARALAAQEAGGGEATAAGRETSGKSETMSSSPGLSAVSTVSPLSDAIEAAALAAALPCSCCVAVVPYAVSGSASRVFFGERIRCAAGVKNLPKKKDACPHEPIRHDVLHVRL